MASAVVRARSTTSRETSDVDPASEPTSLIEAVSCSVAETMPATFWLVDRALSLIAAAPSRTRPTSPASPWAEVSTSLADSAT